MGDFGDRQALLEDAETYGSTEAFWNTKEIRNRKPNWQSLRDAKRIDDASVSLAFTPALYSFLCCFGHISISQDLLRSAFKRACL